MMRVKNVLIVNWGTATAIYVLRECNKLDKYVFYLASTPEISEEIKELFGDDRIVITNPYDPIRLCEDVSKFIVDKGILFDIVTTFFEMCVYQTAVLAEYLGVKKRLLLKDALKTSVNKYLMRIELEKAGLNQPKFFKFDKNSIKEAFKFFEKIRSAAIIKPVHSGHSYGVRYIKKGVDLKVFKGLIDDAGRDYRGNYDEWMKYENMEDLEFLIEEFVDGKIYSFDGIVDGKGRVDFIGSTEFELSVPPIMQQIGHTIPIYSLDPKQIGTGKNYIEKVVGVLNLKYCGFHGEVKYLKNQPVLIEISGRLPGGVITGAYQHLSKYNVFDKFLSVFDEGRREKLLVNKKSYKSETMKIIFSDKNMGIVKGGLGDVQKKRKDFVYKTRSRNEGEKINEKNNPFGIWLYEIVLRSKKLSSRKLVAERDCLIKEQEIQVVGINQGKAWLKQSFAKIGNKLIRKNDV